MRRRREEKAGVGCRVGMLTHATLPSWRGLLRALVRRPLSDADLAAPWRRDGELTGWLSRSAWSLALIALWRQNDVSSSKPTVWIPDFFCNEPLGALRQTGVKLTFYPVTEQLEPDMAACRELANTDPPDLFVLVHYFGQPAPGGTVREFCSRHDAWLIEDAAHVLRPADGIGKFGDFVIYSPHKHLPIPDGAVVVVRKNGPGRLGPDRLESFGPPTTWPQQLRDLQKRMGLPSIRARAGTAIWLGKRVLQKVGVRSWRRPATRFVESVHFGSAGTARLAGPSQSGLSRRLLAGEDSSNLELVARLRQRHQLLWDALLPRDDASFRDVAPAAERPVGRNWTPYLAAYRVDHPVAEATYDLWQRQGLPVSTWPDLSPEVTADQERYANAWNLRHSRLYLPVHQNLSVRKIMKRRQPTTSTPTEPEVRLVWNETTRVQWQIMLAQAGRSSLLQSWAYDEAKSEQSGWQLKRGVFYAGNDPIALVWMLQKRVIGLLKVSRINQSPLLLGSLSLQTERSVWAELALLGNLWQGRILKVAPDSYLSGSALVLMTEMGFRQFSPRSWQSIWIDLELDLDVLRDRLNGKWRNKLSAAEKIPLELEVGTDDQLLDWMMARHAELLEDRDFDGPPAELLLAWRRHLDEAEPLIVLRAMNEGEPVAGICLARHGIAATYLLGWNGPRGRPLRAHQFLLWQAVVHLKQTDVRWFDLGGIDEYSAPGITEFKLGLNGERYELVGEYWKW